MFFISVSHKSQSDYLQELSRMVSSKGGADSRTMLESSFRSLGELVKMHIVLIQ